MKKQYQDKKTSYTKTQYFFWLFSGAEINILKECPTDYNRQAGIGFTIFMTTLFAMFAGGYAGWYFSKSVIISLVFAVIWGLLIFSIDRTLVVTLKKDPNKEKQNFLLQFGGRAVLAGLIAFIISIPLELLIFRDKIEEQKLIDKENTVLEYRTLMGDSKGINQDKQLGDLASSSAVKARENAQNCSSDPEYNNLERERLELESTYNSAKKRRDNVLYKYKQLLNNDHQQAYSYKISSTYRNAISNFNSVENKYQKIVFARNKRCNEYVAEQNKIAIEQEGNAAELTKNILDKSKQADVMAYKLDSLQQESFIRDYIALENAAKRTYDIKENRIIDGIEKEVVVTKYANDGMLFFLWLVRILFFTIEILPTLAKIATPAGAYDRAIKKREDDYALELEVRTEDYLKKQKELRDIIHQNQIKLLKQKGEKELELQNTILENASDAQNKVAIKKIKDFMDNHNVHS